MPTPQELISTIQLVTKVALEFASESYFVGGYPRTLAMGLPLTDVHDLDIASGNPIKAQELAGFVAEAGNAQAYEILHRTNTVRLTVNNVEMDFQGSASHDEVAPYVRLWGVQETPIAKNIFDRDFTMNSLAIKIGSQELLDMTKRGISDIQDRKVVAILPPDVKVPQDPLMITRAIKMAVKYGFEIDPALWKAMMKNSGMLRKKLSPERLAIEAYTLAKYPASKGLIEKLGIDYLESPAMIEQGKLETEE